MDDMKYMLVDQEVQDLIKLSKEARGTDTKDGVINTMLTHLVKDRPYLRPNQIRWWFGMSIINDLTVPIWLLEAKMELNDIE